MAAASSPVPSATPIRPPPAAASTPATQSPRAGVLDDRGVARRDTVHALRWNCEGLAKVIGVADVGDARIEGTLTVGGAFTGDHLTVRGTFDGERSLDVTGRVEMDGATTIAGAFHAGESSLRGTTRIGGEVRVDGLLRFDGAVSAPSVRAGAVLGHGSLDIAGEFSAEEIDVTFRTRSRLGIVRASRVRLVLDAPNPVEMVLGRELPVTVGRIEADRVELEGVHVAFVRAAEITLGRNAQVSAHEGTIVRRHPSARVGYESRSPRPHGLSR